MMLRKILPSLLKQNSKGFQIRAISRSSVNYYQNRKDEKLLKQDLPLNGVNLDDVDELMSEEDLYSTSLDRHYPNLSLEEKNKRNPLDGHNLVVVQPWATYANFDEYTDPDLQLAECVSLGNTLPNWKVIGKKVIFGQSINRKEIFGRKSFDEFKEFVYSHEGVSAVFFGLETLSGIQLSTLEQGLQLPCYDRFTMVLNIFRHHARTKEAKIQIALAELPYIRSNLREIHESSEFSSSAQSLKMLVGGFGDKFYRDRLYILKKRQSKLVELLKDVRKQRDLAKKQRLKNRIPTVSVVGYTNSGKTSLIKFMTNDDNICPKDQLFATLDVTVHGCQLPSCNNVLLVDTVGFISRVPTLLIGAFSATLQDVADSDLIVHILDVTHPDHKLQYLTVMKALQSLGISKRLINSKLTVGNKFDLFDYDVKRIPDGMARCDHYISTLDGKNVGQFAQVMDRRLSENLNLIELTMRVDNGGHKYNWLKKYCSIVDCKADETDGNFLICKVKFNKKSIGRWKKSFGDEDIMSGSGTID